jgi:hypothetical protein
VLADWILQNEILELLYGRNVHPQLLMRCGDIPRFLAVMGVLANRHIDLIWASFEVGKPLSLYVCVCAVG